MSLKNLTWQQIAVFVVCIAAAFAAHQWLGLTAGYAANVVTAIIAFLLGRTPTDPSSTPAATAPKTGAS